MNQWIEESTRVPNIFSFGSQSSRYRSIYKEISRSRPVFEDSGCYKINWEPKKTFECASFSRLFEESDPADLSNFLESYALSFPTVSLNGRYQYAYTDTWGLNCAPQFVYTDLVTFENYMLGVKVGPRYALSQRYLDGWYLSPMILASFNFTRQFGAHAQSAFMIGLGGEIGYTWHSCVIG